MRLLSLELTNVAQIRALSWRFQPGVIGILAPNGAGKSNAMNAVLAAMTNDWSRYDGGKAGAVRQTKADSDPSQVVLRFEHNGHEVEITRVLAPSTKNRLVLDKGAALTKESEVKTTLESLLGNTRSFLSSYVLVHQKELVRPFDLTESKWAQTLSDLCGTRHAEDCWTALGKRIDQDQGLLAAAAGTVETLTGQLEDHKARLEEAEAALATARKGLLTRAAAAEHNRVIKENSRREQLLTEQTDRARDEKSQLAAARKATGLCREAVTAYEEANAAFEEARAAREQLQAYQTAWAAWERRVKAEMRLQKLQQKEFPELAKPDLSRSRAELINERSQIAAEFYRQKHLLDLEASGQAECPTCFAPLTGTAAEEARSRFDDARRLLQKLDAQLAGIDQISRRLNAYETAKTRRDAELKAHQQSLQVAEAAVQAESAVEEPEPVDTAALQGLAAKYPIRERWAEQCHKALNTCSQERDQAVGRHQALKERLADITTTLADITVTAADAAAAQDALASHHKLELQVTTMKGRASELQGLVKRQEQELDKARRLAARSNTAREWLDLCEQARVVLHRDNLPRRVHREALRKLEGGINRTLRDFGTPFRITTDDSLNILAHKRDGTVSSASGLSGGEQGVLALAFRWTLNETFAGQIGMMVLDEPTANLDAQNVDYLAGALERLGGLAKEKGYQVILITHVTALRRVFDQVLTLPKAV